MKILNKTPNGSIVICSHCKKLHLEFGNLMFDFTPKELQQFTDYVNSIDYKYYLELNKNSHNQRKLVLNIESKNAFFGLHEAEFKELRDLLSFNVIQKSIHKKLTSNLSLN